MSMWTGVCISPCWMDNREAGHGNDTQDPVRSPKPCHDSVVLMNPLCS